MDERVLNLLEEHAQHLEELVALVEYLNGQGALRHIDAGDWLALRGALESITLEVGAHAGV